MEININFYLKFGWCAVHMDMLGRVKWKSEPTSPIGSERLADDRVTHLIRDHVTEDVDYHLDPFGEFITHGFRIGDRVVWVSPWCTKLSGGVKYGRACSSYCQEEGVFFNAKRAATARRHCT